MMTIVEGILISSGLPVRCIECDFCVAGTEFDKECGSEWICTAGKQGVHGMETLEKYNVRVMRPGWCQLVGVKSEE